MVHRVAAAAQRTGADELEEGEQVGIVAGKELGILDDPSL